MLINKWHIFVRLWELNAPLDHLILLGQMVL